jgi:hypothetical protein
MFSKPSHFARTALAVAVSGLFAAPAFAASGFAAFAGANLTLVDIQSADSLDGLVFTLTDDTLFDSSTSGAASSASDAFVGQFNDPLGLGVGFDLTVEATADGAAGDDTLPAGGSADAESLATAFLNVQNGSTGSVTLLFDVSWTVSSEAFSSGFGGDDAFGQATLDLTADDGLNQTTLLFAALADLLNGPLDDFANGTERFSFTLAPGATLSLDLLANSTGFASAVPVPAALPLFGSALLGLWGARRRQRG